MFVRVISLVFIFLVRLRFPAHFSIIQVIRKRYGNDNVKLIRSFEKIDFKYRKLLLDIDFLENCVSNNVAPNFVQFRVANKDLRNSNTYRLCQTKLLKQEMVNKKNDLNAAKNHLAEVKKNLMKELSWIDYHHVCNLFLVGNDKAISKHKETQNKKLVKLIGSPLNKITHDPEKVIYNFSKHVLTEAEKSVLCKGLQFAVPPKTIEYSEYMLPFELLFRDIKNNNLTTPQCNSIKSKILDTAFSSFDFLNTNKIKSNLSNLELEALHFLSKQTDFVIQKSDKGNTVVLIDKETYKNKIGDIISDSGKFEKLNIEEDKQLNFLINSEKKLKDILKKFFKIGCLDKDKYDLISPTGSKPGILYGLAKVHKPVVGNCPSFRPILSAIGTSTYNLAKFLVPILKPLTINEFTVKDSFSFANEVTTFDKKCIMASLDIESLLKIA